MHQVSSDGATLTIKNVQTLLTNEFFLVLSTQGKAYRRCELDWVNGDQIGVRFLKANDGKQLSRNE